MIKNIKKITVVGGGSAGWMSASMLIRSFPDLEITVVESPNIPTIGVGESTLGSIRLFCQYLGIDETEMVRFTNATYKMSIKFTDFYKKNGDHFHYPFGSPFLQGTYQGLKDWMYKKSLEPWTDKKDFVLSYFPAAALFEQKKYSDNKHGKFDNFNPRTDVAYHFDAVRFAIYLRDHYCLVRGVKHIKSEVTHIETDHNGIVALDLDGGDRISADLYVDCTGFKSLLLEKTLGVEFDSFADMLPNNRAWACQVPYVDKTVEIEPYTNCTAIENGWVWNTPLWSRIGTGYVYSDKYTTKEQALEQFKNYLCSDRMVIPRSREQVEQLSFRDVPFRVGIHKQTFVKNVVAIGLSAGFLEPLESNGLYSVHEFLFKLVKTLQRGSVTQWDRDAYNNTTLGMFRNFAHFVALHYALSLRDDTEYWKSMGEKKFKPDLDQVPPDTIVGFHHFIQRKMHTSIVDENEGITYVSAGMDYPILDHVDVEINKIQDGIDYKKFWAPWFSNLELNKHRWKKVAETELTLYEYMKKYIYKE
jgi:tryptophan halogenase